MDKHAPITALINFYRAFNQADLTAMKENWSHSNEASMANPLGGIKQGWREIETVYEAIFHGRAKVYVEYHDFTIHQGHDIFYAIGRERGSLRIDTQQIELAIRTTRIFRLESEQWRQIHHHGSIDNPDLLEHYQNRVLAR